MTDHIETIRRTHDWVARLKDAPGVYRVGGTEEEARAKLIAFLKEARSKTNARR